MKIIYDLQIRIADQETEIYIRKSRNINLTIYYTNFNSNKTLQVRFINVSVKN